MPSPTVSVLVRNHFHPLKTATATRIAANAWDVRIPTDAATLKIARRGAAAEDWDGAVFLIGDQQAEPALGSGEAPGEVRVTALVLTP
jgi:hypothetical protein